jgi:hypothetical protein
MRSGRRLGSTARHCNAKERDAATRHRVDALRPVIVKVRQVDVDRCRQDVVVDGDGDDER